MLTLVPLAETLEPPLLFDKIAEPEVIERPMMPWEMSLFGISDDFPVTVPAELLA